MGIKQAIAKAVGSLSFFCRNHAPEIMTGAGIVGVVATVGLTIAATIKTNDILEEHNKEREELVKKADSDQSVDVKKEKTKLYFRTFFKIGRQYVWVILVACTSIALLVGSHKILSKRYAGLVAAYAGLDASFKEYRTRVVNRYGEATDISLLTGASEGEADLEITPDGPTVTNEIFKVKSLDGENVEGLSSPYTKLVTRRNTRIWDPDPNIMAAVLNSAMQTYNDWLKWKGAVPLCLVYDDLGLDISDASCVVGWLPEGKGGDGFVQIMPTRVQVQIDGKYEPGYLLDFNVDGPIYGRIDENVAKEE